MKIDFSRMMHISANNRRSRKLSGAHPCPNCDGDGVITVACWREYDGYDERYVKCDECDGSGEESDEARETREAIEEQALCEARCAANWACPCCDNYGDDDPMPAECPECGAKMTLCDCGEIFETNAGCPVCNK